MAYENNDKRLDSVYSKRIRAGKRRTYFFDVRATRGNDYYLTITESRKKFNEDGYDRHKIFLYKEDFNKFIKALGEAVDFVKTDLMPDFDFDAFNHDQPEGGEYVHESGAEPVAESHVPAEQPEAPVHRHAEPEAEPEPERVAAVSAAPAPAANLEDVDKW